jgi:iron complex outermembrane recepter protein
MSRSWWRASTGIVLLGLIDSRAPAAQAADTATAEGDEQLTEIVVSGLIESLDKSLEIKEHSEVVLDSINAIELGRFPDNDVADSLRHITGVSITRTTGGDGQYVGVRGLGQQYNIVTLNNRIVATDDDGRALAFDLFPADVISGADVYKSSQASALEGSIGGTVNMRSARPLDTPGLHSAVRVEGNYNDMSELWGKKVSAFISDTFADNTLGVLVGYVHSDDKTRTDSLNYNTYDGSNPGVWPLTGPTSAPVVAECCIAFGSIFDEKRRDALSAALQWAPSSQLKVTLDGLYTRLIDPQVAYDQAYYPDFNYDANGNPEWSNVVVNNGYITSFTGNNFTPELVNQTIDRRVTTSVFGLNVAWQPTSNLSFTFDGYRSQANRPEGGQNAFVTSGLESTTPFNQDTINWTNTNGGLPNIQVLLPNGQSYANALAAGQLGNDAWTAHYTGLNGFSIHDQVTGTSLDGVLKLDAFKPLTELRFGVALTWRKKSRDDDNNDWTNGSSQYDFYTTPDGATPITYGSLGANVVSTTTFPNYMQGSGGSFPKTIGVFNIPAILGALKKLDGQPNTYAGGTYDFSATLPQFDAVDSYIVHETTQAAYFEAAFAGERWNGNIGVRVVHTRTTSSTAINQIQTVTIANTANPTDPAIVSYSAPEPFSGSGSYTKPLPSLNFTYQLQKNMLLRFGASETIARPELDQLAPTRTDNTLNRVYEINYAGNADLKPIQAYGADLSWEWYYQPRSALTLAVFGKDIKDFITTQTLNNVELGVQGFFNGSNAAVDIPYTVFQPINGDKGYVEGVELGIQHILDNGFGVHGQFTKTWSRAYVAGAFVGQLEGVSSNSASLGVLYEKGRISANVNWDYDGPSVAQTFTEIQGVSAYQDSFSWVTAQVSFEFLPGAKIYFEGRNLSNAIARTYLANRQDLVWASGSTGPTVGGNGSTASGTSSALGQGYTAFGRDFLLGLSYRF